MVPGFLCSLHKLVAQQIGISTPPWTGGQHYNILVRFFHKRFDGFANPARPGEAVRAGSDLFML